MDWEEEGNPHNTEILSNFTQYSGRQPVDLDMGELELSDRMEQIEKRITMEWSKHIKTSFALFFRQFKY